MKKLLVPFILICGLVLSGCSSKVDADKALSDLGMTNIRTTGYAWFGCGDGYTFHTGFYATNQQGKEVSGVVCSGWLGYSQVKFQ